MEVLVEVAPMQIAELPQHNDEIAQFRAIVPAPTLPQESTLPLLQAVTQNLAPDQAMLSQFLLNNLQHLLNSPQFPVQYNSSRAEGSPMVHLTLAIPSITTTFHLPGTAPAVHFKKKT